MKVHKLNYTFIKLTKPNNIDLLKSQLAAIVIALNQGRWYCCTMKLVSIYKTIILNSKFMLNIDNYKHINVSLRSNVHCIF